MYVVVVIEWWLWMRYYEMRAIEMIRMNMRWDADELTMKGDE